ncbi:hypothetical protein QT196_38440 [Streptomyces sp. P9-2B-2]|uniref:hypothetical protein n=1 Tax=Streptomyces sp. P9-2B-2 TaxID=3057114 RepID=UPI0025B29320|nr:hypothetical protein [Streptomyces sp. P9-2B-2]WJY35795.1 hypothetical protein QT196_00045 [Streptomyces sp. P9-2B-2]WJY42668.1 hypothetical protein QT196_38440 [Streptomyces sp. P9-2B-2]
MPMQPLPSYQLIPFLDWLHQRKFSTQRASIDQLDHLALEFLRSGGRNGMVGIMILFQTCPVLSEPTVEAQMDHFSGCGRCIEMLHEESFEDRPAESFLRQRATNHQNLHPFLSGFVDRMAGTALDVAADWNSPHRRFQRERPPSFRQIIQYEIGSDLRQEFQDYLSEVRMANPGLVENYESWRSGSNRACPPSSDAEERRKDPTIDIGDNESLRSFAQRLSASAQIAIQDGFYDEQIAKDSHFAHMVAAIGDGSADNAAQILEFLNWLHQRAPELTPPGNIPHEELEDLAQKFCENRGYTNGLTFSKEAQRWLSGAGSKKITRRIARFLGTDGGRSRTGSPNPLDRYAAIRFHGLFMFLSSGDFPRFISDHWRDLHHLTGDDIDIYYSQSDLTRRTSGYEIANHFRSLQLRVDALPALLLWEEQIEASGTLPLRDLDHIGIVEVMKTVVQAIRDGCTLENIIERASSRTNQLSRSGEKGPTVEHHGLLVIGNGGVVTHETHNISGSTIGAVGSHAVAHDNVFFQDARSALSGSELTPSDSPAVSHLAELIASRKIEGLGLSERLEGAYHLSALADAAAQHQAQEEPLAGWKKWITTLGDRGQRVLTFLASSTTIAAPIARLLGVPV